MTKEKTKNAKMRAATTSVSMHHVESESWKHTPFQNGGDILPVLRFGSHAHTKSNSNADFTNDKERLDTEADEQDSSLGVVVSADPNVLETHEDGTEHVAHAGGQSVWRFRSRGFHGWLVHKHNQEAVVLVLVAFCVEDGQQNQPQGSGDREHDRSNSAGLVEPSFILGQLARVSEPTFCEKR